MSPLRTMFAFDTSIEPVAFARSCREWGIGMPILSPAFFQDRGMATALESERLPVWLNLPVFFDPGYLESHPDRYAITSTGRRAIDDWVHFACPGREETVDHAVDVLRAALANVRPAVVSLDFIRHFVFWERVDLDAPDDEMEDGCYCPTCLSSFERDRGETVNREDPAADIGRRLKQQWGDWKCQRITQVAGRLFEQIRELVSGARLAIKVVPWRESDLGGAIRTRAGQDVLRLSGYVDIVAPMAFTQILHRTPGWKTELLSHVHEMTGKPVLSYVQVDPVYRPEPITPERFAEELVASSSAEYAGLSVFHYEQLAANPEKARIARELLRR